MYTRKVDPPELELDEIVHDLKGEEAAAINNAGKEAQIAYILQEDSTPLGESPVVTLWLPGGVAKNVPLAEALAGMPGLMGRQAYAWERHEPGVDCEITWEDDEHEHETLEDAVSAALPCWRALGLTFVQAAVACMSTGLVVSTGVEGEEE
jgi:hypothetical protein